ncbi:uncharacterized protein LOC142181948 [Nicotiana tabacum]|uniref:Uncharacterized protein LOC142181948 n=1 Tax=Nicotiana tabacum TaxID=4097 RepID=A0AC58UQI7_TOBAC
MDAPPNFEEGQSTYRPSRFNSQYYGWWKTRMHDFIMVEDSELWDIICDGPHVPMKKLEETVPMVPKDRKDYSDIERKAIEKNYRAKKILVCGIRPDEYNRVSACDTAKEIWETLQTAHEGTTQVKQSKIDMLTTEYELFRMNDDESANIVKQALATWGDSSNESEREPNAENNFMIAVETEATNLDNDKEILTIELGEAEQSRDDLETIEGLSNKKHTLEETIAATEQERDDFLVIITNLEETIEEINREHRTVSLGKGKEVVSETHIKLEHELNYVKTNLCGELEKNRQLQAELEKVKIDLEKSLKWTWSSDVITVVYLNNSEKRKGYILNAGKVGKSLCLSIENVYYVDGLKYNPLSVSQICDKGNKVEFLSKVCTVTNLLTGKVILVAKRDKNIYVADFESLQAGDMRCLKLVNNDAELWHGRLGHTSFSLLNKLIQKDLVRGLSNSRFTRTLVLRTKDETFEVFRAFIKKIQMKIKLKAVCIRSDHGTECDNAKFDELVTKRESHTTYQHQGLHNKMVLLRERTEL